MAQLRQLVLAATDFDAACSAVCAAFDTYVCHVDPSLAGLGLQNALFPVGECFIEIVSPIQPGTTGACVACASLPRPPCI
jgi:hypothetical protein